MEFRRHLIDLVAIGLDFIILILLSDFRQQMTILVERINVAENWSIETALKFLGRFRTLWPKTTAPDSSRSTYLTALSQV